MTDGINSSSVGQLRLDVVLPSFLGFDARRKVSSKDFSL
jgi:hypothetical protein